MGDADCDICRCCTPTAPDCLVQRYVRPGQARIAWRDEAATAIPTVGPLRAGHLLIVPRRHVTSTGCLSGHELAGIDESLALARARLEATYDLPILFFEYGLNIKGGRRVEHAHIHALPTTTSRLLYTVSQQVAGEVISSLSELPKDATTSYIFIEAQDASRYLFPVPNDVKPRLRLREIVAPHITLNAEWDWEKDPRGDLIQQTLDDLGAHKVNLDTSKAETPWL